MLNGYLTCFRLREPGYNEQLDILQSLFAEVSWMLPQIVSCFVLIQILTQKRDLDTLLGTKDPLRIHAFVARALEKTGLDSFQIHVGRHFSQRDLFKWCHRIQVQSILRF